MCRVLESLMDSDKTKDKVLEMESYSTRQIFYLNKVLQMFFTSFMRFLTRHLGILSLFVVQLLSGVPTSRSRKALPR